MAQYGGDQQYGREVRQTDEYGNPIQTTNEYETLIQSAEGGRYEHEVTQTDEYGNIVRITEEYQTDLVHSAAGSTGHPQGAETTDYTAGGHSTGQTGYLGLGTEHGTTNRPSATPMGGAGIGTGTRDIYGGTGTERGGHDHEKKSVVQKIKEKLPGGHSTDEQKHTTPTTTAGDGGGGDTHEKKGIMEKIKEKLPGHH